MSDDMRADSGQFDSARSHGSGGKDVVLGDHSMDAMYGVGNLQSSPAMKTFYNKALLSTAGSDVSQDFHAVVRITASFLLEMGKNPNPARTNRTRTRVLPRTEPKFLFSYASTLADCVSIRDGREPKILGSCFSFRFFDERFGL